MPPRFLSRINAQSQVLQDVFGNAAAGQKGNNSPAPPSVLAVSPPSTAQGSEPSLQRRPQMFAPAEFPRSAVSPPPTAQGSEPPLQRPPFILAPAESPRSAVFPPLTAQGSEPPLQKRPQMFASAESPRSAASPPSTAQGSERPLQRPPQMFASAESPRSALFPPPTTPGSEPPLQRPPQMFASAESPRSTLFPPPTAQGTEPPLQRPPQISAPAEPPGSAGSLSATPKSHRSRSRRRHGPSLSISSHTSIKTSITTISTSLTPPLPGQELFAQESATTPPRREIPIHIRPPALPRQDSIATLPPQILRQDSVTSLRPPVPTLEHKAASLEVPKTKSHHRASSAPPSPSPGRTFASLTPEPEPLQPIKRGRGRQRAVTRASPPPRYSSRSRHRAASHTESLVAKLDLPPDSLILVTSAHTVLGQNVVGTLLTAGFRVRGIVPDAERAVRGFRLHREIFGPRKYTASVVDNIKAVGATRVAVRSCQGVVVIDEKFPDMDYVMNVLEAARGEPHQSVERVVYCGAEGPAVLSVARDSDGSDLPPYGGEHEEVVKWKPPPLPQMPRIAL